MIHDSLHGAALEDIVRKYTDCCQLFQKSAEHIAVVIDFLKKDCLVPNRDSCFQKDIDSFSRLRCNFVGMVELCDNIDSFLCGNNNLVVSRIAMINLIQ